MPDQLDLLTAPKSEWLENFRRRVKSWADQGVYFGGSSWKYEGWLGQIYDRNRYNTHGKFSQAKFDRTCLTEYAETFSSVCGDFAFYKFYGRQFWADLFAQVPSTFLFGLKVPEAITSPVHQPRGGYVARAGEPNDQYLDADVATTQFVEPLIPHAKQVGYVVFEFPQTHGATDETNKAFLEKLDGFFEKLPRVLPYSVEIRTESLIGPEYFSLLKKHGLAHTFNSWTRMPAVGEQLKHADAFTADFTVARLLLRPGRTYEKAVKSFQPYDTTKDPFPEGYRAAAQLVKTAKAKRLRSIFISVNNRFDGNAPLAISAIMDQLEREGN